MHAGALLSTAIAAALCVGCSRTPTPPAAVDAANAHAAGQRPASAASTAAAGEATADAQAYYARLVAEHGEDLSECPAAETARPEACAGGGAEAAAAPRRVLLMLDASGSMAAREGGTTKLAAAQDALVSFAAQVPADAQLGLRVYGHRGSNREADKAASCRGTELVHAFSPYAQAGFETAVRSFQPRGFTPIAASLQAAAQDFAKAGATEAGNVVYLVSDGIETCGGDPAAAARALHASNVRVVVNVIGFDLDAQAERQLRSVAEAGGGQYVAARSAADLQRVFNQRFGAALRRYNCESGAQLRAFNRTSGTNLKRTNCLSGKALREYNAVSGAALRDLNADRATRAQYDYATEQARRKREATTAPAQATYESAAAEARDRYETDDAATRQQYESDRAAAESARPR